MKKIRTTLLLGLLLGTLLCTLIAGVTIYRMADDESNEQSDMQLKQIAVAMPAQFVPDQVLPGAEDPDEIITIQVWDGAGRVLYVSHPGLLMAQQKPLGYQDVAFGGQDMRVYTIRRDGHVVQVYQPVSVRHEFAASMAMRILLPLSFLLVALAALICWVVEAALAPLNRVAEAVAQRSPHEFEPFELGHVPADLAPIVGSLNHLLTRIGGVMAQQQTFVADAAHELRSPLTALKLHLQVAERAPSDAMRAVAFGKLHDRLDRSAHLVKQMLTLALHEPRQMTRAFELCDLDQLARQAVVDHAASADSKVIDLGLGAQSQPVPVLGHLDGLQVMLNNLLDNALRYTQATGQVDVYATIADGRPLLCVVDNGPGIPEDLRERVFDRFYRPEGNQAWGCGLGLSIVKNIADLHGAQITLGPGPSGSGLSVTVALPATALRMVPPAAYA